FEYRGCGRCIGSVVDTSLATKTRGRRSEKARSAALDLSYLWKLGLSLHLEERPTLSLSIIKPLSLSLRIDREMWGLWRPSASAISVWRTRVSLVELSLDAR